MSQFLFIWAVTAYLVSLSGSLLLSFFYKKISDRFIIFLGLIHFVFLILWFWFNNEQQTLASPGFANYCFLLFFCTGILIAGTLLRKKSLIILKFYFSLFLMSAVLFVFNPSLVIGFIVSGNPRSINPGAFHLYDNVYMMQQQTALAPDQVHQTYKITMEMGVFHKTLVRDIELPFQPDSISAMELQDPDGAHLKLFYSSNQQKAVLDTVIYYATSRDSSRVITRQIKPVKQQ
jgi:hypothetical protein